MTFTSEPQGNATVFSGAAGYLMLTELILPFLAVIAFLFDREVSEVLYAFGFDPTALTSLFFLDYRYNFFLTTVASANLHLYDFHIFQLVALLTILVVFARLVTVLFLVDYLDARIDVRAIFPISPVTFFFGWLLIGPGPIFVSMDVNLSASTEILRSLMAHSPRAFLCVQAVVFCCGSAMFCEGIWLLVQRAVAVRRRGNLIQPMISP